MILSISKFKLYYPNGDSEYSGGGDEGGAKESDPSSDPGTSTPTGSYGGSTLQSNTIAGSRNRKIESVYKKEIKPEIYYFTVSGNSIIQESGESKKIKIQGTPDSIFSLTIKDSTDCSILKEDIENVVIPSNGIYEFDQTFPSIFAGASGRRTSRSKEIYTIKLTPAANVSIEGIDNEVLIHQYANPVVTITKTTSQTGPAISVSGSDITKTGSAGVSSRSIQGYSSTSSTWTITADSEDSGTWYVKNTDINNAFETNTVIKKKIDRCGETGMTKRLV